MMYAAEHDDHTADAHHHQHGGGGAADVTEVFDEPAPNLEVIYQAFGEQADLYKDVLQVKSAATAEQIQMAYFDRRSELFALLASIDSEEEQDDITASHRFHAERKMDAVVMAVRILGDPQLRQEYDNVMVLQGQTKKHPKEPPSGSGASRSSSTREPDGVYAGVGLQHQEEVPPSPRAPRSPQKRSPKRRSRHAIPPLDQETSDDAILPTSASSDEMLRFHDAHQYQEHQHHHGTGANDPEYEFIAPSSSKGSSKGSKGKSKKKHKDKQQQQHHSSTSSRHDPYQHNHHHDSSYDQSTLNRTAEDDNTTFQDEGTMDDTNTWDDQNTIGSDDWTRDSRRPLARGHSSALSAVTNVGIVSRIQEEVAGTVEDTLVSFEQVLNVFTLQDKDILAVMGRIDKAKRQLRKRE